MTQPALRFEQSERVGRVAAVDTSKVLIDVDDPSLITRVGVGNLLAVRGPTENEFLIGITERITRSLSDEMLEGDSGEKELIEIGPRSEDVIRAVLIGTFRTIHGDEAAEPPGDIFAL